MDIVGWTKRKTKSQWRSERVPLIHSWKWYLLLRPRQPHRFLLASKSRVIAFKWSNANEFNEKNGKDGDERMAHEEKNGGKPKICPCLFLECPRLARFVYHFELLICVCERMLQPHQLGTRSIHFCHPEHTHTRYLLARYLKKRLCVCVDPCYTSIYHPYLFFQFRRIQFCWLNFWHCFRSIYSLITVSSFKTLPDVYIPISWTQFENEPTHTHTSKIDSSRSESGHSSPNSTLQHREPAQKFHL